MSDETEIPKGNPPKQGVPSWHADPQKIAGERLWDGTKWTSETRGDPPKPEAPVSPSPSSQTPEGPVFKGGGSVRGWIRNRPVLWVSITAFVALVIGIAVGGDSTEKDDRIASLEGQVASLEGEVEEAQAAESELAREAADLEKEKKQVAQREKKVGQAERLQKRNTITDGIWKVGTDFDAGTYRSGDGDCYWAKLSSAGGDFDSIISNGNGSNQTVTIDSPWFESSGCGEWTKIE